MTSMKDSKKTDLDLTPIDQELDAQELQKLEAQQEEEALRDFEFKLNSRRDERNVGFYLLYALDRSDYQTSLSDEIKAFEKGFDVTIPKTLFSIQLVKGVVERRDELDEQLKPYLKNWSLERLGCCTRLILWLSLWEMQQPGAIPSIVINEAIELAKTFAEKDAYRFINGILDEIAKKMVEQTTPEPEEKS
jgi:N utilization substance protein B